MASGHDQSRLESSLQIIWTEIGAHVPIECDYIIVC